MPWGGGGRRRLALGKSRLSHLRTAAAKVNESNDDKSGGNPLAGLIGGYDEDDDGGEADKKLLESTDEEAEEEDSPDEPSPERPNEDDCDWAATTDPNTGKEYYWNKVSGKTSWEKPTELIDLDHRKDQYKRMKELVDRKRAEKKKRREQAQKEREERKMLRAKLRAKAEAERIAKEEEEKKKAEEMKSQLASFMNMIDDLTEEQKKKKAEEEEKKRKEEEEAAKKKEEEERKRQEEKDKEKKEEENKAAEILVKSKVKKKTKWRTVKDKKTGKFYFWNKETKITTWEKPDELKAAEKEAEEEAKKELSKKRNKRSNSRSASSSRSPSGSRRRKRSRSRNRGRQSSRTGSKDLESQLISGENEEHQSLLIKAMAAGIRCCIKDSWPDIPEGESIPDLTRVRVELDLRIADWENGHVNGTSTAARLKELGEKMQNILDAKTKKADDSHKKSSKKKDDSIGAVSVQPNTEISQHQDTAGKKSVALQEKTLKPESISSKEKDTQEESSAPSKEIEIEMELEDLSEGKAQNSPEDTRIPQRNEGPQVQAKKKRKASKPLKMKNKKMAGLVSKWTAVQRQRESEEPKLDAYERRKLQEAKEVEDWKQRQVETGAAISNENFIPVGEDTWKHRIKRNKNSKNVALGDDW